MGKFKRIQVNDIKAMQKTLDDLPDKNLGKTREETVEMLNTQILKALDKGYSLKEITELMARGNVFIPAPVIRAKVLPAKPAREKAESASKKTAEKAIPLSPPKAEAASKHQTTEPSYYTADRPDTEL